MAVLLCLSALALRAADSAATPAGRWRTFDDKTGKAKAVILLYEEKGLLNAAAALVVAGRAKNLKDGVALGVQSLDSGAALVRLKRLVAVSNS